MQARCFKAGKELRLEAWRCTTAQEGPDPSKNPTFGRLTSEAELAARTFYIPANAMQKADDGVGDSPGVCLGGFGSRPWYPGGERDTLGLSEVGVRLG
eukprot:5385081-Prorocentrum_lima.AAC.1